jgi:imidazole glycerol phosphate synthase subunit HisF
MKRVIATAILLCQIAIAFGQQCVISARKENIVYIGVPNPIDIAVEGRFCRDFTVSTKNGTVEKQKVACNYAWSPAISGTTEICVKEQIRQGYWQGDFQGQRIASPCSQARRKKRW